MLRESGDTKTGEIFLTDRPDSSEIETKDTLWTLGFQKESDSLLSKLMIRGKKFNKQIDHIPSNVIKSMCTDLWAQLSASEKNSVNALLKEKLPLP